MLLSLALLSLLASPVLSLECYVCSSSATNEECNQNTQECQAPLDICMTTVDILGTTGRFLGENFVGGYSNESIGPTCPISSGSTTAIVKQCASQATCNGAASSASVDSNGNGNIVNCCNTFNLCNFSGAESVHAHTTLLLLTAAGAVLLLLSH